MAAFMEVLGGLQPGAKVPLEFVTNSDRHRGKVGPYVLTNRKLFDHTRVRRFKESASVSVGFCCLHLRYRRMGAEPFRWHFWRRH
jgi:hypothetical protein